MYHLARSSPVAGRVLFNRLRALLRHYGTYHSSSSQGSPPVEILTDHLVERVLTESCFMETSAPENYAMDVDPSSEVVETPSDIDNEPLMAALQGRYSSTQAANWTLAIPPPRIGPASRLVVPGWVRARAAEVLFNDGPDEDESLPEIVLNTLEKVSLRNSTLTVASRRCAARPSFFLLDHGRHSLSSWTDQSTEERNLCSHSRTRTSDI